jgi:DNA-binding NarL/FixJ family response regulator
MLVGRANELARIAALIDGARLGRSGALVLRGDAGIGKTALLGDAASADGFNVLRARGIETEAEIAFSGLHDLLGPILDDRERLPEPQADALASALSLGPGGPAERLAIYAGVLGLLAVASDRQPILAIVDDVHLLDRASADALAFAARRLHEERIAMLFAIRDGESSSFTSDGIDELRVEPLDDARAAELLDRIDRPIGTDARARILELAQGNPLALVELPSVVDLDLAGGSGTPPLRSSGLLSRAFGHRIERLPPPTRTAIQLAAASDDDDLRTILVACRMVGIDPDAFAPAEAAGIIAIDGERLTFRHPLIRAAAYGDATPAEQRDAHRALAQALVDRTTEARWAWHRALAAVGPDDAAAMALERVAGTSKSASASARALERAARLSADPSARTRRLLGAALAAESAGRLLTAERLAEEVRRDRLDVTQVAEVDHLLGRIWTRGDAGERAVEVLTAGAAAVATTDPHRAALMLADAVEPALDDLERAEAIAEQAARLLPAGSPSEQLVMLRLGDVRGWRGDAPAAARAWRRAADLAVPEDPWTQRLAAEALFSAGLDDEAVGMAHEAVDASRAAGLLNSLTRSLEVLALAEARRGRLQDALEAATDELDLLAALGHGREERIASRMTAWIEALLGREADCRVHAARAARAIEPVDDQPAPPWAFGDPPGIALGILELSLGRPDVATTTFLDNLPDPDRLGADAIAPRSFVPSLVEALVLSGRSAEAAPIAEAYGAVADRSALPTAQALALRCRGLATGSADDLQEAAGRHATAGNRYEAARTQLCLGDLLRHRGMRSDAQSSLRAAIDGFDLVGAHGWGDRARAALEAAGASGRRSRPSTLMELTPQERTVARLVATGLTNRAIAGRLFVTTNTVETHLRHIFQKLDVTSRTQLAIRFTEGSPPTAA